MVFYNQKVSDIPLHDCFLQDLCRILLKMSVKNDADEEKSEEIEKIFTVDKIDVSFKLLFEALYYFKLIFLNFRPRDSLRIPNC